jgi:hypothetical protein
MAIGVGTGGYARGRNAIGICERCSHKMLRRLMVYDGQFPDLLVCPDCWDPKHPQEYLTAVTDPVTIYDPTGDPDKFQANRLSIPYPPINGETPSLPLQIGVLLRTASFIESATITGDSFDRDSFDVSSFDIGAFDL